MKRAVTLAFFALLSCLGAAPDASADELVQVAPHRAAASPRNNDSTPPLLGFLTRPGGPGRFPAVVLLHWCPGFTAHDTNAAATLKSWGYVALAVDSLGDANMCERAGGSFAEAHDAFAALRYLAAQSFVASERVAVMGYSMGALGALLTIEKGTVEQLYPFHFRAAAAWYPPCQSLVGALIVPALVLIGEQDDWTPADACRKAVAHESDFGIAREPVSAAPMDLVVYPDATHAFDFDAPPGRYLGYTVRFDAAATRDANARVRAFLREQIGDQPELP